MPINNPAPIAAHLREIELLKRYHFNRAGDWRRFEWDKTVAGAMAESNCKFHLQRVANLLALEEYFQSNGNGGAQ